MMRQQRWWLHTTIVVGAALLFMILAAWVAQPWWEYAFLSDDSAVSWLSSALLIANAAVALNLALTRTFHPLLGGGLALALSGLAADEHFLFHEQFKHSVPRSIGEAPTILVGVGGIAIVFLLNRSLRAPAARYLIVAAVAVGLFALWVDLGTPPAGIARFEEAFEVLAEALFLSGLLESSRAQVQSAC
jgi:hypothetical protein